MTDRSQENDRVLLRRKLHRQRRGLSSRGWNKLERVPRGKSSVEKSLDAADTSVCATGLRSGDGTCTLKCMRMRYLLPMLVLAAHAANPPVPNRSPLQPNAFNTLPLGSVMPKGWLLEQLR